jgi:hypothetical protein
MRRCRHNHNPAVGWNVDDGYQGCMSWLSFLQNKKSRSIGISTDKAASYHKDPARKTSFLSLNTGKSLQIGFQNMLIALASQGHKGEIG